jgi:hypothetical protein
MLKQIKLRNLKGCHGKKISKRSVLGMTNSEQLLQK